MQYSKFDVIVIDFPFIDDRKKSKVRPAVIVSSDEYNKQTGFVVVAMITSAKHSKLWNDVEIASHEKLELSEPSIIRMKFANVLQADILATIGTLDKKNQSALQGKLSVCFGV
jgi:mRNA interferase MazF